jgi:cytochrome c-type biogenesis protein CcmH/NrfG
MTPPSLSPDAIFALKSLAHTLLTHRRDADAEAILTGLTTLAPRDPYPWIALAQLATHKPDLPRAAQLLQHALKLEPSSAPARFLLATLYIQQQDPQNALATLTPFAKLPDQPSIEARRAHALYLSINRKR